MITFPPELVEVFCFFLFIEGNILSLVEFVRPQINQIDWLMVENYCKFYLKLYSVFKNKNHFVKQHLYGTYY
jgi:hypothetical protein